MAYESKLVPVLYIVDYKELIAIPAQVHFPSGGKEIDFWEMISLVKIGYLRLRCATTCKTYVSE
jgi:hypothetical protein